MAGYLSETSFSPYPTSTKQII
uniref:Uncharacterized protein n=1 Tax=Arundo donax TaxID=35708 RepID=A0A0A9EDT1_ARUDO